MYEIPQCALCEKRTETFRTICPECGNAGEFVPELNALIAELPEGTGLELRYHPKSEFEKWEIALNHEDGTRTESWHDDLKVLLSHARSYIRRWF
jgi:hypothetical protein